MTFIIFIIIINSSCRLFQATISCDNTEHVKTEFENSKLVISYKSKLTKTIGRQSGVTMFLAPFITGILNHLLTYPPKDYSWAIDCAQNCSLIVLT